MVNKQTSKILFILATSLALVALIGCSPAATKTPTAVPATVIATEAATAEVTEAATAEMTEAAWSVFSLTMRLPPRHFTNIVDEEGLEPATSRM